MKTLALIATLAAAAALAGCGDEDAPSQPNSHADGPGISIDEALASSLDQPLLVNGNLLSQGGEVRLCSALAESFPPQCGGSSLQVEGLELEWVEGIVTEGDVSWTDRPVQLLGVVADGTLTVSENAAE
ncbi:MAG: hypothetical protein ACRDNI_11520 [Gaiellaceae bacterium]